MRQTAAPMDRETFVAADGMKGWGRPDVPVAYIAYLAHTEGGHPMRAIARATGQAPSTVLRQIRRIEARREDPLLDDALKKLAEALGPELRDLEPVKDRPNMTVHSIASVAGTQPARPTPVAEDDARVPREARRILRRLCESGAFLAVATTMEKAVVLRESVPGRHHRTAVVDRDVAHRFALLDWIACAGQGSIARYTITDAGRAALKRLLEEDRQARAPAPSGAATPFRAQHSVSGERRVMEQGSEVRLSTNLAESPLTMLGRKRDRNGEAYLTPDLIEAGERLREDFEVAQIGPRTTQNWQAFLTPRAEGGGLPKGSGGNDAARDRVHAAMEALGPGLWDVAFRVCCFLEGIETAEKRLGWSARSGKVVLRIALERLARHYGIRPRDAVR